ATYWERIQAAAVLFLLSLASLWYLFVNIHFDLLPAGLSLLSLLGTLAVTGLVIIITVLRPAGLLDGLSTRLRNAGRLWPSVVITLMAHACMLCAYLSLLWGLGVARADGAVVAALIIVMFTSSLPISFSGWGIRELSAAQALGTIGIDESAAVASAVAIGLLYLFLVVAFAVISSIIVMRHRRKYAAAQPAALTPGPSMDWSKFGVTAGAILCAMLLFFQLRIPVGGSELTANVADLIALTSLGLAPYFLWTHRHTLPLPRVLLAGLVAMSLVIVLSLTYGYMRFGWTSWAFLNRGLGWLIILGYVAIGIGIAMSADTQRRIVLSVFVATGTSIATIQIILMFLLLGGIRIDPDMFSLPLKGHAGNTNAFAVQMIMTAAAAVASWHLGIFARRRYLLPLILSVIGAVLYFTHSRAGLGMFAILLTTMMLFPANASRRSLLPALLWPILAVLLSTRLYEAYAYLLNTIPRLLAPRGLADDQNYVNVLTSLLQVNMQRQSGDLERWTSITEGWTMWLQNPLFGKGLGAFMNHYLTTTGGPLVIHSVPVWLLAETGLAGLLVVAGAFLALFLHALRHLRDPGMAGWAAGLLIAMVCISAGSIVHDFFFQRSFWFLLGLFAALPIIGRNGTPR
ncbi:MAG: O-antigen ligase family protein, partial [Ferrovibrio sp.]